MATHFETRNIADTFTGANKNFLGQRNEKSHVRCGYPKGAFVKSAAHCEKDSTERVLIFP